jgi:hypothetical protein
MRHEGLGSAWPFAAGVAPDTLARSVRPLLKRHLANAMLKLNITSRRELMVRSRSGV